jgi:N-acetylated-alpha-linked acidic dipeptidase
MKRTLALAALLLLTAAIASADTMLGFSEDGARKQAALETEFDSHLDKGDIREWIRRLSARPHHVGSAYGKDNAEFMLGLFRSWGWEAEIEEYQVLFPTPKMRRVEMLEPRAYTPSLLEDEIAEDSTSGQSDEQLPPYNAYSVDGDVTGELVYVNQGIPDDYDELDKRGISVEGKIVIARYGGSWRGIKPKVAAEKGAIGCILYSDPGDDGFGAGDTYPRGGYRPPQGAQRGSVADMPLFPGDPLTPFVGATADAERLPLAEAPTLTKIPVLPLSWRDAAPLMEALGGPAVPGSWRGGLPITYHFGPGPAKVRLQLEFNWDLAPAYNVVARIPGSELPDQWIVRGNHHDAWVNGAADPVSGMAAVLAEAQALGELMTKGWRPKRTIVYAGWDAEEPGLLGSTEWAEHHADELRRKAAVYINSDSNSRGFLSAGGSHTLERLVNQVANEVMDPQTGISVGDRRRALIAVGDDADLRTQVGETGDLPLSPLGSGSDYTPFLQHLGVASLNVSFGGEGDYGQYHSIYDSFDHYSRYMDPGFDYGVALAQVNGRLVMRLANADVLPFEFTALAATVARYVDELEELADSMRKETAEQNRRLERGVFEAAWDPNDGWTPPPADDPVPHLNFAPLRNGLSALEAAAKSYDEAAANGVAELDLATRSELDRLLYSSERALTRDHGLPGRPWFVHHVYAPGFYTGYGVKTLPGVREAIETRLWAEVDGQITIAAEVLREVAGVISAAAKQY